MAPPNRVQKTGQSRTIATLEKLGSARQMMHDMTRRSREFS
jgi:hypothetical protein